MQRGFIQIPILIAIIVTAVLGGGAYVAYETVKQSSDSTQPEVATSTVDLQKNTTADATTTIQSTQEESETSKENKNAAEINVVDKQTQGTQQQIVPLPVTSENSTPKTTVVTLPSGAIVEIDSNGKTVRTIQEAPKPSNDPAPTTTPVSVPTPKVKVTAEPSNIEYDGTSVISWVASDALSCTLDSSPVLLAVTGSQSVKPTDPSKDWAATNKTTYTVTCTGSGGSASGDVTVTIQPWEPPSGFKVLPAGQCTFATAPCITGPGGWSCIKGGCGG